MKLPVQRQVSVDRDQVARTGRTRTAGGANVVMKMRVSAHGQACHGQGAEPVHTRRNNTAIGDIDIANPAAAPKHAPSQDIEAAAETARDVEDAASDVGRAGKSRAVTSISRRAVLMADGAGDAWMIAGKIDM